MRNAAGDAPAAAEREFISAHPLHDAELFIAGHHGSKYSNSVELIESIGAGYIGTLTGGLLGSHYTDIFAFVVLIIVLTLRPSGLLGERVADRA